MLYTRRGATVFEDPTLYIQRVQWVVACCNSAMVGKGLIRDRQLIDAPGSETICNNAMGKG